jgi:subtilisin family serine protease
MRKLALLFLLLGLVGVASATTFTPDLTAKLNAGSDNELIRILITMKDQVDSDWLFAATDGMNKQERRQFVVDHLNQLAEATQAGVKAYLESWEASGNVKHLQSVSIVNLMHCQATPEVIRGLMNYPEIGEVAYDPERYMLDDAAYSSGPATDETDEIAWGVIDVHAPEVWQQGFTGAGVLVSVLDTGVNYNHLDLADHMWDGGTQYPNHGYDFNNNDNDPMDLGPLGHGTHVAGSIASDGTAGSQCGVAPDATIMAVQVWSGSGYGNTAQMISGINFSVQQGVDIWNMSGGISGGGSATDKNTFRVACNNALAAGVIGSIAAGNEAGTSPPNSVRVPGNCPPPWLHPGQTLIGGLSCVVTAGATQSNHTIASFSSRGPVTWATISPWFDYAYNPGMGLIDPDISAPGVDVKSCAWNNISGYLDGWDGTSMATPHIAGGMALLLSKDPNLTPDLIDMYLETYSVDLGAVGKDNVYGAGLLNCLEAINAVPMGTGPYLIVASKVIDDIGGNNNNAPDPGETCSMVVTLNNVGQGTATNVVGTLSTTSPYLTITQNTSNYPNLAHLQQGQGSPPYMFDISSNCPQGQSVICALHITADSAYTNDVNISFIVGDPLNSASGPDAYGYSAYDPFDVPELPVYQWVEISSDSGGPGTMVPFTLDDQTFQFALPFTFQYYGVDYDSFTIATNGWIAMGVVTAEDYNNSGIPDPDGPERMIAAYWEDLSPQRTNSGKVWQWFDATNHRLIVEYNHIEQFAPTGSFETFQVILFDPAFYTTNSGDGRIKCQYKDMSTSAQSEGTMGIENAAETIGIQYFFDGAYEQHAHSVTDGFAVLYTTPVSGGPNMSVTLIPYGMPIVIPANGGSFSYNIAVANLGSSQVIADIWCDMTLPNGHLTGPTLGPVEVTFPAGYTINRDRNQNIPRSAPPGNYTYNAYVGDYPSTIYDQDSFPFTKSATGDGPWVNDWANTGQSFDESLGGTTAATEPEGFAFHGAYPNPFNPRTAISYQLSADSHVSLRVYDLAGRMVAELVSGIRDAGVHQVTWDASGLPSGLYFCRIQAGGFTDVAKMMLVK